MCVIFVGGLVRPTIEMVEKGFEANDAGAGIAWKELNEEGVQVVRWEKGLNLEDIQEYVRTVPLPFTVHFRIPSCGGKTQGLCHPFPVTPEAGLELSGETSTYPVIFHNGHWPSWKTMSIEACVRGNVKLPDGDWSDTRVMAWIASRYGASFLKMIDEKVVIMRPNEEIEILGVGWTKVNEVWCSNTHWERTRYHNVGNQGGMGGYTMCREKTCTQARQGNSLFCGIHQHLDPTKAHQEKQEKALGGQGTKGVDADAASTFCNTVKTVQGGKAEQQEVEEGTEGVGSGDCRKNGNLPAGKETTIMGPQPQRLCLMPAPKVIDIGQTGANWPEIRRWVRHLNDHPKGSDSAADLAARRTEQASGIQRVGPI